MGQCTRVVYAGAEPVSRHSRLCSSGTAAHTLDTAARTYVWPSSVEVACIISISTRDAHGVEAEATAALRYIGGAGLGPSA